MCKFKDLSPRQTWPTCLLLIEAVLVQVGDRVRLVCDYAEGRDQLYSVKWYKDNMEFYRCTHTAHPDCQIFTRVLARYVPKDRPRGQRFPVEGVEVELGQSDHSSVTLAAVSLATAGTIMCEVGTI